MFTPNTNANQFVDANLINASFGTASGAIAYGARTLLPLSGLLFPEAASYTINGYSVSATLPSPFGIVNASGTVADAHGTVTGQDTQSYSVSFSGLVPSAGTTTGYLAAQFITIQEGPVSIAGPPPGHPSYNPNFTPTTGYSLNVDTFSVIATLSAPDNKTVFELARCILNAGATGLAGFTTQFQKRAGQYKGWPINQITASGPVTQAAALYVNQCTTGTLTTTLPPAAKSAGLELPFVNATGNLWTIAGSGSDLVATPVGPHGTVTIQGYGALNMWCDGVTWYVRQRSVPPLATRPRVVSLSSYSIVADDCGAMLETTVASTITLNPATAGLLPGFNIALWCSVNPPLNVVAAGGARIFGPGAATNGVSGIALSTNDFLNLLYDGFNWIVLSASPWMLRNAGITTFDGSGNFVVPPNVTAVDVLVVGGGGGAAGSNPGFGGAGTYLSGGGAGAGGYARKHITGLVPGQTIPVTVGIAGLGGGAAGNGGNGSTSSFGAYCSATGGFGGQSGANSSAGGPGGNGVGGDENGSGGWGGDGQGGVTNIVGFGNGGASVLGGAIRAFAGPGGQPVGGAPGGGGGGCYGGIGSGTSGNPGRVVVEWDV